MLEKCSVFSRNLASIQPRTILEKSIRSRALTGHSFFYRAAFREAAAGAAEARRWHAEAFDAEVARSFGSLQDRHLEDFRSEDCIFVAKTNSFSQQHTRFSADGWIGINGNVFSCTDPYIFIIHYRFCDSLRLTLSMLSLIFQRKYVSTQYYAQPM